MIATLAKIWPLDPVTGDRVEIRVSAHGDGTVGRKINGKNNQVWAPAMVQPPVLRITLWDGAFASTVSAAQAGMQINLAGPALRIWPNIDRYAWAGAKVEIYAADPDTAWPWPKVFAGKVATYSNPARTLALSIQIDTEPFQANVLTSTYAGTGGAEGGADLTGRVKPLVLGWARNVEPVLINAVDSVFQFSGYGPIEEVTTLFERGSAFGASVGDFASYAALVGASIAPGKWGTCLAQGLIRLGAPPFGVITGDIKGHEVSGTTPRLTGAVMSALAGIAGINTSLIDTASLAALDTAVPYPINLVIDAQVPFLEIAQRLALPCNAQAGVGLDGRLFAARIDLAGTTQVTLHAQGKRKPLVTESREEYVSPPFWRTVIGANRSWRVHSAEEIAFEANLVPRGPYVPGETYREGQYTDAPDGSQWLYINAVPTSGNAPPAWPTTSNTYWENLRPPLTAEGITYSDGVPIEDLRPAEPGADVTANAQVVVAPPAGVVVYCNSAGAPKDGQLVKTLTPVVTRGGIDIRTDNAVSYSITAPSQVNASINNTTGSADKGRITIGTSFTGPGTVQLTVTVDGTAYGPFPIAVDRINDPPANTGGGGGSGPAYDSSFNTVSSTSFNAISDELGPLTITAGQKLVVTAPLDYDLTGTASITRYLIAKAQYWDGAAWQDFPSSPVNGSNATWNQNDLTGDPGSINLSQEKTGLSAGSYKVRLVAALSASGSSAVISIASGTMTYSIV